MAILRSDGATDENRLAAGFASSCGRGGTGENMPSSAKSSSSLNEPFGLGDPDIILTLDLYLYFHFVDHIVAILIKFEAGLELAAERTINYINDEGMDFTHGTFSPQNTSNDLVDIGAGSGHHKGVQGGDIEAFFAHGVGGDENFLGRTELGTFGRCDVLGEDSGYGRI
jgi:hypothetical protein